MGMQIKKFIYLNNLFYFCILFCLIRKERYVGDKMYNRTIEKMRSKYTKNIDLGIRQFVSLLVVKGYDKNKLNTNQKIIDIIEGYNKVKQTEYDFDENKNEVVLKPLRVNARLISDLKYRAENKGLINFIPRGIKECDNFIKYIVVECNKLNIDIKEEDFYN
jgi:hypothetical protein